MFQHDYFEGQWQFRRRIEDHKSGQIITASGTSSFSPHQHDLLYLEKGRSSSPIYQGEFFQEYLYQFPTDGLRVLFKEGYLFYKTRQWNEEISHTCGQDLYLGCLRYQTKETWSQIWQVHGPRKSYLLETYFSRTR